jgi:hypothetical protein
MTGNYTVFTPTSTTTTGATASVHLELALKPELSLINDCLHHFHHLAVDTLEPVMSQSPLRLVEAFKVKLVGPSHEIKAFCQVTTECGLQLVTTLSKDE